ncbi:hypothetical protein EMIHUDRAFT_201574 [Emiliania huxleyi CCMP1516]|uniref:RING-type domain-containing protein n=2 Tax=Emiliania huxleyi TaxID=2903 RepID=A0A0D3KI78_EMIH1|nr:hypothetical protein EMIHUDRAFT_201574 [Emiliania huxleyi CCMP1516]EOD35463.1 hypothetical protein EMIHUDRAFT_201574 [Emiliania huxleyi CCMP1516]|eukprot:XP_005787892.1 hypothetical protein EMIHUDRAFT_201574 [Emiliania huxleyi CCMP1516]
MAQAGAMSQWTLPLHKAIVEQSRATAALGRQAEEHNAEVQQGFEQMNANLTQGFQTFGTMLQASLAGGFQELAGALRSAQHPAAVEFPSPSEAGVASAANNSEVYVPFGATATADAALPVQEDDAPTFDPVSRFAQLLAQARQAGVDEHSLEILELARTRLALSVEEQAAEAAFDAVAAAQPGSSISPNPPLSSSVRDQEGGSLTSSPSDELVRARAELERLHAELNAVRDSDDAGAVAVEDGNGDTHSGQGLQVAPEEFVALMGLSHVMNLKDAISARLQAETATELDKQLLAAALSRLEGEAMSNGAEAAVGLPVATSSPPSLPPVSLASPPIAGGGPDLLGIPARLNRRKPKPLHCRFASCRFYELSAIDSVARFSTGRAAVRTWGLYKRDKPTGPPGDPLPAEEQPVATLSLADAGFDTGRAAVPESTLGGETTCIVCFTRPKDHVAIPCGHQCACAECSAKMEQCPICRQAVLVWMDSSRIRLA